MLSYEPRDAEVVWEVTEGEVLLMDLAVGIYYSIRGGTAQLVSDLLHGLDPDAIVGRWMKRFPDTSKEVISTFLQTTIESLKADNLVRERSGLPVQEASVIELTDSELYPVEKYEDMKEIFEMDPIHDGDTERGWPIAT